MQKTTIASNKNKIDVFYPLICAVSFFLTAFKIITNDIWFELLNGKVLWKNFSLKFTDLFTFTVADTPWVNQEWLFELVAGKLHDFIGFEGLIFLKTAIVALIFCLLYRLAIERGSNRLVAFWVVFIAILLCRYRLTVRPQVVSFLFIVIFLNILTDYHKSKRQSIFLLPLLLILWTNLHFASVFGLILISVFLLANLIEWITKKTHAARERAKHLLLILVLGALGCLVNPAGYQFYTLPLEISALAQNLRIIECISPLQLPLSLFPLYWCVFLVYVTIIGISARRVSLIDALLFLCAVALSLKMMRFIAIFAILTAPLMAKYISALIPEKFLKKTHQTLYQCLSVVLALSLSLGLLSLKNGQLHRYEFGFGINEKLHPFEAVAFLKDHSINGNIFSDNLYSGQILWHLWPQSRVFNYGRFTVGGQDLYDEYNLILAGSEGWEKLLNFYDVDIILMGKKLALSSPFLFGLAQSGQWKLVFLDDHSMIFLRYKLQYKDIIEKNALELNISYHE